VLLTKQQHNNLMICTHTYILLLTVETDCTFDYNEVIYIKNHYIIPLTIYKSKTFKQQTCNKLFKF